LAGHAREVIRFIQERRKSDGFEISDRIDILWNATPEIVDAIESDMAHIQDEVLAISMLRDESMIVEASEIGLAVRLTKSL
jgi:isoleucyl-tRNA synthetase